MEKDKQLSKPTAAESESVKKHYEKWPFPDAFFNSREGLILLKYLNEILNNKTPGKKRIIDIGCGTGHGTVAIARHFPEVDFIGLDLSQTSIKKAQETAKNSSLQNVTFLNGDICSTGSLPPGSFDLVISTGVLHHIKDANQAFVNMTGLLKPDAILILWLYGRYGRLRHSLNQAFINILSRNKPLNEKELIAREFICQLGEDYAIDSGFYTPYGSGPEGLDWLMNHRQWLTDQMIPPYERCYTMKEILDLFRKHGLSFRKWLGVSIRLESSTSSTLLLEEFNQLTSEEQLLAIDYLIKPEYYFVSGQKEMN